ARRRRGRASRVVARWDARASSTATSRGRPRARASRFGGRFAKRYRIDRAPYARRVARRERIGVFGGTFDPIHVGHLVAAVTVRHTLALTRVLLVVANVPWQKEGERVITPAEDRLALVEAAVGEVEGLEASRIEIERGGASYSAGTVEARRV